MGMKNKHLEHPEDSIFTSGRKGLHNILNFLEEKKSNISVKYDGAPAIVWGINPDNNRFFVGTKSVFNKVKVKINYNHYDIEENHGHVPAVASILHLCFEKLPRIEGVHQCDFIGYGGGKEYTPNTITYKFDNNIEEDIIVAAHTTYEGKALKHMCALYGCDPIASEEVKFLNTDAEFRSRDYRIGLYIAAARVASNFIKFPNEGEGKKIKIAVNKYIREGRELDVSQLSKETGFGKNLFQLYKFLIEIKELLMESVETFESVDCFICDDKSSHEGYVMTNEYGTFKLINRKQFSYANFNLNKKWNK
jgi:hypothetical protein